MVIGIASLTVVLLLEAVRVAFRASRLGIASRDETSVYTLAEELTVESDSPEQGVEEALQHVGNCSKTFRLVSKEKFLHRLSIRGDDLTLAAARRLDELR